MPCRCLTDLIQAAASFAWAPLKPISVAIFSASGILMPSPKHETHSHGLDWDNGARALPYPDRGGFGHRGCAGVDSRSLPPDGDSGFATGGDSQTRNSPLRAPDSHIGIFALDGGIAQACNPLSVSSKALIEETSDPYTGRPGRP